MREAEVLDLLRDLGAIRSGHFRLSSGLHSDTYFQCALALQRPADAERLARALAEPFRGRVSVVVGPALGAVTLAHEVARALDARALFAEREADRLALRRGFRIERGETVLVVEDVVTSGGSVAEVVALAREAGGEVVGVGAIVDRTGGRPAFELEFRALARVDAKSWPESECPLCASGVPVEKPGSRPQTARRV